jgi:ribosomal-protein-serine acetyltransferase
LFEKGRVKMTPQISISKDLCLRVLRPYEAGALYSLISRNRDHLREWLPWVDDARSMMDSRQFLEQSYMGFLRGGGFNFGIRLSCSLVGVIGFHGFDRRNRVTSLGYWLAKDFCGQGIMHKSVATCIDYAINAQGMNRIYLRCAVDNLRSKRIPELLGMVHEGTQREAEWLYDHYVDLDVYSILSSEWDSSVLGRL